MIVKCFYCLTRFGQNRQFGPGYGCLVHKEFWEVIFSRNIWPPWKSYLVIIDPNSHNLTKSEIMSSWSWLEHCSTAQNHFSRLQEVIWSLLVPIHTQKLTKTEIRSSRKTYLVIIGPSSQTKFTKSKIWLRFSQLKITHLAQIHFKCWPKLGHLESVQIFLKINCLCPRSHVQSVLAQLVLAA